MGMSTHVKGVRDLNGRFQQMLDVKDACDKANCEYPDELCDFFDGDAGESVDWLRKNREEIDLEELGIVIESELGCSTHYEIDVKDIPPEVKTIRFTNTW